MITANKLAIVSAVAAVGLAAHACVAAGVQDSEPITEQTVQLSDGRTVQCLSFPPNSSKGGLTCDWANAK